MHPTSSFGYYPLAPAASGQAEAPDIAPERRPEETDVWLTAWQIAEEGFDVALGDDIAWALVPMDQTWARHLLGERRVILLQLDTYATATRDESHPEWTHLTGCIIRLDQVSALASGSTSELSQTATGAGVEHKVSNLRARRAHAGELMGWIARVRS